MRPGLLEALLLQARVRQLIRARRWVAAYRAIMALEAITGAM